MRLANRVAIITGGGSGLGRASSLLFAAEGAKVVVAQRTARMGEETVAAIKSRGGEAMFVRTDITSATEVQHLIDATIERYGKIDILLNNAGIGQEAFEVDELDEAAWDNIFDVNAKGTFLTIKYTVPFMKKAKSGAIINISSIAAVRPRMKMCAYIAAKGAVIHFTKALALDLAKYNIRVNCINPVTTDTPLVREEASRGPGWDKFKESRVKTIPLGRLADPEDTAYAALYLASDESAMVTGICIDVDGGRAI